MSEGQGIYSNSEIDRGNNRALEIFLSSRPLWIDVRPAQEVLPGMDKRTILHAGPPIEFEKMCGPQRNGVLNAVLYEGLAATRDQASRMIKEGKVHIAPCHSYQAVGGMAGITSASMPMIVVKNETFGSYGYSQLFQGPGIQGLRWADYGEASIKQWQWLEQVLGPALGAAIRLRGGVDTKAMMAKALQMGDECHNRSSAGSALFMREMMPYLLRAGLDETILFESADYLAKSDQFFLCVAMASARAVVEPAKGIQNSTIVTTMARNGVEFGIKVSALGDEWFTSPANVIDGLYFSSEWGVKDAVPDIGDSAIMETIGLGGFVQATAPALQQFVGGSFKRASQMTSEMREICCGTNMDYQLPNLDFAGAPIGIDIRKVLQTGIAPIIDTAIAHKEGGVIGAGQVRAPIGCFEKAFKSFGEKYSARK
jgi:hypothetical protein